MNMSTPHVGSVGFRFCLRSFRHHWKLFGCMLEIDIPRKLEVIPVRDVRRFLVESCGLTKSDVDNAECGNEDLQQVFLWALGLEQAPRSNHYCTATTAYHLQSITYYLPPTTYYLLQVCPRPRRPFSRCVPPLCAPPRRICICFSRSAFCIANCLYFFHPILRSVLMTRRVLGPMLTYCC